MPRKRETRTAHEVADGLVGAEALAAVEAAGLVFGWKSPPRDALYLTASRMAALCEVDLKTIHNWVERGKLKAFRTPGRHLRFVRKDAVAFLEAQGYTVPEELKEAP